ncbi:MAG: hypothetical protein WC645_08665 [Candidatus Margulisiibacteriota bacterium]
MRRLAVVVVMICLALPMAVPARADFGLVVGVLSLLFDLKKNDDNFKATAPMERSDTQMPALANLWWEAHWVGCALNLENSALQVRQGAVVEFSINLLGKPHLLGCPTLRLKSNQEELGQVRGGGAYVVRGGKIVVDTRLLPTKAYDVVVEANFTNGEDQAGRKGRGRVPHPDSTMTRFVLVVMNEDDITRAANNPGVQQVLSWSSGLSTGVPVLSGPKFELSPEIVRETGLDAAAGMPPTPQPAPQLQYQPPAPKPEGPRIEILDQPGPVPNVDVSRLECADLLQSLATEVGYNGHLLRYVPAFNAARCRQFVGGKKVMHPLVIFFVNREMQILDCASAQPLKRRAGCTQFKLPTDLKRDLGGDGQYFMFIADAKPGDAFAPVFGGRTYHAVEVKSGCGAWYPVIVE